MGVTRQTGQFVAKDEQGGEHVVRIYTDFIEIVDRGGRSEAPGLKSLVLDDGEHVNRSGKGVYETASGVKLTSDDPAAP